MCIYIDMIYLGIVTHNFLNFCTRVMALDLRWNIVSAQFFENYWTYFHQILYMHIILTRSSLGLLHIFFQKFVPELWPFIYAKVSFPLNILNKSTDFHQILYMPELILGCRSVIITPFWQYWPQISSSLRGFFHKMLRFGAIPVILCVLFLLFAFQSLNSIPFV